MFVITRLSRAMRSLKHLLALADQPRQRGADLVVLRQHIDTTPAGRLELVDQASPHQRPCGRPAAYDRKVLPLELGDLQRR